MLYELMIVAKTDKGDSLVNRVQKTIKEKDAKDIKVDNLGKKPLAYPIKKQTDAAYFLINFNASGSSIKPLSDMLRLEQEDLLRYLIVKKQEKKLKAKTKVKAPITETGEEKAKPKVTVAVKQTSRVKSTKVKSTKSTKVTKGKSKK